MIFVFLLTKIGILSFFLQNIRTSPCPPCSAPVNPPGAVIDSVSHLGQGVYSGTFSGKLFHPIIHSIALQKSGSSLIFLLFLHKKHVMGTHWNNLTKSIPFIIITLTIGTDMPYKKCRSTIKTLKRLHRCAG